MYKMMFGKMGSSNQLQPVRSNFGTRGHSLRTYREKALSRERRNCVTLRAFNDWNYLPEKWLMLQLSMDLTGIPTSFGELFSLISEGSSTITNLAHKRQTCKKRKMWKCEQWKRGSHRPSETGLFPHSTSTSTSFIFPMTSYTHRPWIYAIRSVLVLFVCCIIRLT